jgi:hypothetical protein
VKSGREFVIIRPWPMALRNQLKPLLLQVATRLEARQANGAPLHGLADAFDEIEDQLYAISRITLGWSETEMGERLDWEDLPTIAQAILETCLIRSDGGGVAGKLLRALIAPAVVGRTADLPAPSATSPSISTGSKPAASPSSPDAGAPTPTASAGR